MTAHYHHDMPFGAATLQNGGVRFRLWAPAQKQITLMLESASSERPMKAVADDWFELVVDDPLARDGALYRYKLADGSLIPDPASRFQPRDVHGPSQIIDGANYPWQHDTWRGRPWEETVLYELHTGCFSSEGTFDGVRRRLDHLAKVGVTAVELMPVSDFEGARNWGYDGVLPFAPDSSYGAPDALKRLIDEAHGRDLMMFLDVVYNHFGPRGNYLKQYAPIFFTERHQTPWGAAINFDDVGNRVVRDFFIHNALYWLDEYRFDGLRFDAVHAIKDDSTENILTELAVAVRTHIAPERHVHLVLENDDNASHLLERDGTGRPRYYTAQWNDDFHHCAHVLLTGERDGYYADYSGHSIARFGRVLAEGFAYQGDSSPHRDGRARGEPSGDLPPTAFVSFLQNHDQIGNRAFGDRLASLVEPDALKAMQTILLLSPEIPLIFMGEEWGTRQPFLFFCDFHEELATAVRDGRRREFARFPQFQASEIRDRIPDPNAVETFQKSRLDWDPIASDDGRNRIERVRELLAIRRDRIAPLLRCEGENRARFETGKTGSVKVCWWLKGDARLHLLANLAATPAENLEWPVTGEPLCIAGCRGMAISTGARLDTLPPWSVIFALERNENVR
jgi:maltooligosyltrehalose trehalohydrolase